MIFAASDQQSNRRLASLNHTFYSRGQSTLSSPRIVHVSKHLDAFQSCWSMRPLTCSFMSEREIVSLEWLFVSLGSLSLSLPASTVYDSQLSMLTRLTRLELSCKSIRLSSSFCDGLLQLQELELKTPDLELRGWVRLPRSLTRVKVEAGHVRPHEHGAFTSLIGYCVNLTHIDFSANLPISRLAFEHYFTQWDKVKTMRVGIWFEDEADDNNNKKQLAPLIQPKHLTRFEATTYRLPRYVCQWLSSLPTLTCLVVQVEQSRCVEAIAACPCLTSLDICLPRNSVATLCVPPLCYSLQTLRLKFGDGVDFGRGARDADRWQWMNSLGVFASLTELDLGKVSSAYQDRITPQCFADLKSLTQLTTLLAWHLPWTAESLHLLPLLFPRMTHLKLSTAAELSERVLTEMIPRFTKLVTCRVGIISTWKPCMAQLRHLMPRLQLSQGAGFQL